MQAAEELNLYAEMDYWSIKMKFDFQWIYTHVYIYIDNIRKLVYGPFFIRSVIISSVYQQFIRRTYLVRSLFVSG